MKAESDIWQVMTQEGVYQADLDTLKQWISEGLVLPTDRVRKGSFNWIEAGRAPLLRRVFSGEEVVEPAPVAATATMAETVHTQTAPLSSSSAESLSPLDALPEFDETLSDREAQEQADEPFLEALDPDTALAPPPLAGVCHFHSDREPEYLCRACESAFCRECTKLVSNSVALCSLCGELCRPYEDIKQLQELFKLQTSGFGMKDFRQALAYPFQHKVSLIFGAVFYGLLLLIGIRGQLLASAIMFGCISLTINRVAYGKFDRDFMPDFSSFSFWDDVLVPLSMGLGVAIVTAGPTIVLLVALLFGWVGGTRPSNSAPLAQAAPTPSALTHDDMATLINGGDAQKEAELEKKVNGMRPGSQIAEQLKQSEEDGNMTLKIFRQLQSNALMVVLLLLATLGWAIFYYPMALAVAGYTEDFKSVVNPLVGIDTIKRMGWTYGKAFGMYLVVQVVYWILGTFVNIITAPFNMPLIGNLPGTFLDGVLVFYGSLVLACILGLALFKSADSLGIEVS